MGKNNLELKNPSKKSNKCFVEDAELLNGNPFQYELKIHYPYECTIDITNNKISFLNRDYKPIGLRESVKGEDTSWYRFDTKQFDLKRHAWTQMESFVKDGSEFLRLWIYNADPWLTQKSFIEYMNKLNYLESLMGEVSPFIKRYILVVNRAYDFAKQTSKSNN